MGMVPSHVTDVHFQPWLLCSCMKHLGEALTYLFIFETRCVAWLLLSLSAGSASRVLRVQHSVSGSLMKAEFVLALYTVLLLSGGLPFFVGVILLGAH